MSEEQPVVDAAKSQKSEEGTTEKGNNRNQRQQKKNTFAPKRGPIIDLEPLLNKEITLGMGAGRSVTGILTGFDQLMNVVLENATVTTPNYISFTEQEQVEKLDRIVVMGRMITTFEPMDGYAIVNEKRSDMEFII